MNAFRECHEEVSRNHEVQPCNRRAVALRIDPDGGMPYPVCVTHTREAMLPLDELIALLMEANEAEEVGKGRSFFRPSHWGSAPSGGCGGAVK